MVTKYQGGNDGGRSQAGQEWRSSQARIQSTARMKAHGGVNGGRSNSGDLADNTWGVTDGDEADGSGTLDAGGEQMGPGNTDGPGGRGRAAAMSARGA